jgi:hypothetical protein
MTKTASVRWSIGTIVTVLLSLATWAGSGAALAQAPTETPVVRRIVTSLTPDSTSTPGVTGGQGSGIQRQVATPTPAPPTPRPRPTPTPAPQYCMRGQVDRYEKIDKPLIQIDGRVLNHKGKPMRDVIVRVFAYTVDVRTHTEAHGEFQIHGLVQAMDWNVDLPGLKSPVVVAQFRDNGQRVVITFQQEVCS